MAKHLSPGGLLSYFTRHGTAANLLLVILIVLGLAALPRMRAQFFPDIVIDNVSVSVKWSGAGAEDVDAAIVQVLEPALLAVEGVESSRATSSEGARVSRRRSPPCSGRGPARSARRDSSTCGRSFDDADTGWMD